MSNHIRYLLTVDSKTGATVKVERLGEAGELTEVPVESITMSPGTAQPSKTDGAMLLGSRSSEALPPPAIIPGGPPPPAIIPGGPPPPAIIPGGPLH